jgi:hypothetical protein
MEYGAGEATMTQWLLDLPVPVQAALVGALASIIVGFLRDFASKWWSERREAKRSARDIYRRYAEPLASAVSSLFWRLKEAFGSDGRGSYLTAQEPRTHYEDYKLRSTYYRLASVLGWIRALRRELSFFRTEGQERLASLENAIAHFEASLADGHHVELQRLDGLLHIWGLRPITDGEVRMRVAVDVENHEKRYLQRFPVASPADLPSDRQGELCTEIAELICTRASLAPVSREILVETQSQAIRQIAIKEAWLYRDWQAAIGGLMIREATAGDRHFEVLGFGEFESMLLGPTEDQFRWLCRIAMLFDELDLERDNPFDARPTALRKLYQATAQMVKVMSEVPSNAALIDSNTVSEARRALNTLGADGQATRIGQEVIGSVADKRRLAYARPSNP